MWRLIGQVDALLRGELTRGEDLRQGRTGGRARSLVAAVALLGVIYGAFMGLHAVLRPTGASWAQLFAAAIKVPLLFLVTLGVTFPSLYVLSTLLGSRLRVAETLRLLLCGMGVHVAVLASLGPVTGFFTLSTSSYRFMVVLNVVFFALGGGAGLAVVLRALRHVFPAARTEAPGPTPPVDPSAGESVPAGGGRARLVFRLWVLIYGVVGAQTGWILRPFIGAPGAPFELFRERDSNFFQAVLRTLRQLFLESLGS